MALPSLQQSRGWSHEVTKNVLNANKMTGIVNDVFRFICVTIGVYVNSRH